MDMAFLATLLTDLPMVTVLAIDLPMVTVLLVMAREKLRLSQRLMLDICMEDMDMASLATLLTDLPMVTVLAIDLPMVTVLLVMARETLMLSPRLMLDICMEDMDMVFLPTLPTDLPMVTVLAMAILMVIVPLVMARERLMLSP